LTTIRENAPDVLDLLAQIVLSPAFPDTSVESARSYFLAKAAEDVESPLFATYSTFLSTMYRGSPLARPPHGTVQALSESRRSDVIALYKKFFVGGNMAVSVVGNVDGKKTMIQLEKLFAAAPTGPTVVPEPGDPVPLASDTVITTERPILARSLVYGYPAPGYAEADYAAFMILDSYLRSADRSPITFWMPQRGQAAAVGVMFPSYPRRSSIAVHLGAPPEKYAAARDTVAAVLKRLRSETFEQGDWTVHVKRVQSAFFWKQNEPVVRARNLSRWEIQGVSVDYPRNFETALLKLKPEDVRDAANRWFTHAAEVSLKPSEGNGQP
jgi:predicted Zn-dependent peptidase